MAKNKKEFSELLGELKTAGVQIGTLEETIQPTESWSTGNIALDNVIGIGGIPVGRIVELYGKSMSGKTTAAIQTAVELQKKIKSGEEEGYILFMDFEQALDLSYCSALGLDTAHESFVYLAPRTLEEGANAYRKLLNAGYIRLCVVDSVAAMVSQKEVEGDTGMATVADRAKALYQFCRQILGPLQEHRSSIIFLNHLLDVIPTNPMAARFKTTTTPGGNAIPYYASLRIEFAQVGTVKTNAYDNVTDEKEEVITATSINATVTKNKVAKPRRVAKMRIRFGKGFSQPYSVYQVLMAYGLVKKSGAWYDIPDDLALAGKKRFHGEEPILASLETSQEGLDLWTEKAQECVDGYTADTVTLDLADDEEFDTKK